MNCRTFSPNPRTRGKSRHHHHHHHNHSEGKGSFFLSGNGLTVVLPQQDSCLARMDISPTMNLRQNLIIFDTDCLLHDKMLPKEIGYRMEILLCRWWCSSLEMFVERWCKRCLCIHVKEVFDCIFKTTYDSCLRWLQYKLLYRLLPHRSFSLFEENGRFSKVLFL